MLLLYFTTESGKVQTTFLELVDQNLSSVKTFFKKNGSDIEKKLETKIKEWRKWSPISGKNKVDKIYAVEPGNVENKVLLLTGYEL